MEVLYIDPQKAPSVTREAFDLFEHDPFDHAACPTELIVLKISGVFAAYAKIRRFDTNDNIAFLEVQKAFRGQTHEGEKISRRMLREVFERCGQFSSQLVFTRYTDKGRRSLLPIEDDVAKLYPHVHVYHQPGV